MRKQTLQNIALGSALALGTVGVMFSNRGGFSDFNEYVLVEDYKKVSIDELCKSPERYNGRLLSINGKFTPLVKDIYVFYPSSLLYVKDEEQNTLKCFFTSYDESERKKFEKTNKKLKEKFGESIRVDGIMLNEVFYGHSIEIDNKRYNLSLRGIER